MYKKNYNQLYQNHNGDKSDSSARLQYTVLPKAIPVKVRGHRERFVVGTRSQSELAQLHAKTATHSSAGP